MEKRRVGIWLRVSTTMQVEQTDSLEHHEARARAYCEAKGWKVEKIYRVEAVSGKVVFNHPTMREMLQDIESGKIDTLVFSSLSRLARNTKQLLEISEIFQKFDASLVSLKESIDTSSPAGRLFFTLLSALATFEAEEVSARVKASIRTRAEMGKTLGGTAPFGYKYVNQRLVIDPKEAPIRKEAFEIFLETQRKKTTARILNEKGYRTRKGAKFTDSTVGRMLTDTVSKGLKRSNYTSSHSDGSWDLKNPEEWIYTEVPAIVSEELFDKVNHILQTKKAKRKKPTRLPVHPFSGFTYCACGSKMRVLSSTPNKYTCPDCRAKINKEDLEHIYKEQLKNFMLSPKKMEDYLLQANEVIEDKEKQLDILEEEKSKISKEAKKLYDLYMHDALTIDGFKRSNEPLDARLIELETTIPTLEAEISLIKQQILDESEIHYNSQSLYEKWDSFSHEDKIQIITNLTDRITIHRDEVEIQLHFIPSLVNEGNRATKLYGCNSNFTQTP
jgi:site-specific DNA recombinase